MITQVLKFIFLLLLLFAPTLSVAGTILASERSIGKVNLGMTEREFQKVTGVKSGDCLGNCKDEESYAEIDCTKSLTVCNDVPDVTGIEVFFWKRKIYYIGVSINETPIEKVKKQLTAKFGSPHKTMRVGAPGLYIIGWKNDKTEISAVYSDKTQKAFILNFKDLLQHTKGAQY